MQELIEEVEDYRLESRSDEVDIEQLILIIETEYIEKEKQILIHFIKWVGDGYDFKNSAEKIVNEYHNETFKKSDH